MPKRPKQYSNLQKLIKVKALASGLRPDADLASLALSLLFDLPDDVDHHAGRARVKLDILRFCHDLNESAKKTAPAQADDLDGQLLQLLASRRQARNAAADQPACVPPEEPEGGCE